MKVIDQQPKPTRRKSDGALGFQFPVQDESTGDFQWIFLTIDDMGTLVKHIQLTPGLADDAKPTSFWNEVP